MRGRQFARDMLLGSSFECKIPRGLLGFSSVECFMQAPLSGPTHKPSFMTGFLQLEETQSAASNISAYGFAV